MRLLLASIKSDRPESGLELKYLYSVVADSPMDVHFRYFEKNAIYSELFEEIASGRFNIVYFHADRFNEGQLRHVAEMVKKAVPSVAVLFGGPEVSYETRKFMKENTFVDYVIRGEGEKVLFNFVRSLLDYDFDFENIAGLAYRDGTQVVVNPYESPIDIERLPFPYERFELGTGTVYYETIRGTSDRTVYSQHLPDARVRSLSLGRICTELRYFLAAGVERVVFLDRWFNYNSERAYRILEYIINNDNGVTSFEFSINGDELDEETIRLLSGARKGQITFNIDVASINAEVLAAVGKSENVYRLMYNTTKLLQNGNVCTVLHVTAGLPMETEEMFARSFNKTFSMAEGMPVKINCLCMDKGTVLREEAYRFGYIFASEAPYEVICSGYLSADEMLRIRRVARTSECFAGNGDFAGVFTRIMTDTGLKPYELFNGLATFVSEHGLSGRLKKKENLARILYAYAGELYDVYADPVKLDILRDIIYSDLSVLVTEDSMRKFDKKGWDILPKKTETILIPRREAPEAEPELKEEEVPETEDVLPEADEDISIPETEEEGSPENEEKEEADDESEEDEEAAEGAEEPEIEDDEDEDDEDDDEDDLFSETAD